MDIITVIFAAPFAVAAAITLLAVWLVCRSKAHDEERKAYLAECRYNERLERGYRKEQECRMLLAKRAAVKDALDAENAGFEKTCVDVRDIYMHSNDVVRKMCDYDEANRRRYMDAGIVAWHCDCSWN